MELKRSTHSRSRAGEYFNSDDLTRLTGKSSRDFPAAILKELVDNAVDACESGSVQPEIAIELVLKGDCVWLIVSDNGSGIPPSTIEGMLDYSRYVSDKWAYVSPTRGAQGNALKTVIGMPHALGAREPRIVTAQGIKHIITTEVSPTGGVDIRHNKESVADETGTRWEVPFPAYEHTLPNLVWWARSYAFVNPHCFFEINTNIEQAKWDFAENSEIYKPSNPDFKKWKANASTPPRWYTPNDLNKLIHSYLSNGEDTPLGEFVRQFSGLKSSAKAKRVTEALPDISYLSDLNGRGGDVDLLLEAMQKQSKPPKHSALGRVGKDHLRECMERFYGIRKDFKYEHVEGWDDRGLPFVFEIAVALTKEPGDEHYAINHAPIDSDPFKNKLFLGSKVNGYGISGLSRHAQGDYEDHRVAMVAHLIHPNPPYTGQGKASLVLEER